MNIPGVDIRNGNGATIVDGPDNGQYLSVNMDSSLIKQPNGGQNKPFLEQGRKLFKYF